MDKKKFSFWFNIIFFLVMYYTVVHVTTLKKGANYPYILVLPVLILLIIYGIKTGSFVRFYHRQKELREENRKQKAIEEAEEERQRIKEEHEEEKYQKKLEEKKEQEEIKKEVYHMKEKKLGKNESKDNSRRSIFIDILLGIGTVFLLFTLFFILAYYIVNDSVEGSLNGLRMIFVGTNVDTETSCNDFKMSAVLFDEGGENKLATLTCAPLCEDINKVYRSYTCTRTLVCNCK